MASQVHCDMVAAVEFYGDESGDISDPCIEVLSIAGFVATVNDWSRFADLWQRRILDAHQIPYVHMREFDQFKGPFERFKKDEPSTVQLLKDIATVIREAKLRGSGAALILSELDRYNFVNRLKLDPYGLCLYVTFGGISARYPRVLSAVDLHIIMDRAPKGHLRAEAFFELLRTDREFQEHLKSKLIREPVVIPLPASHEGSRKVPALQAADFAAWEFARAIKIKLRWFLEIKPNLPDQSQNTIDQSLIEYQAREKKVSHVTPENYWATRERRSFANILMHGGHTYRVIDFQTLEVLKFYRGTDWPN
jgi:hypothetical protein